MCSTDSWWEVAMELRLEQWDGAGRQAQEGRGCMCVYGWFTLADSRNSHSIVKQLSY